MICCASYARPTQETGRPAESDSQVELTPEEQKVELERLCQQALDEVKVSRTTIKDQKALILNLRRQLKVAEALAKTDTELAAEYEGKIQLLKDQLADALKALAVEEERVANLKAEVARLREEIKSLRSGRVTGLVVAFLFGAAITALVFKSN